jgi:hypothetical protein
MKNSGKITLISLVLFFAIIASTCREDSSHHRTIEIINNSDRDIYACFNVTYPDTLGDVGGLTSQPQIYKIESHATNKDALWKRDFWEDTFNDGRFVPSDTLMVFIMDAELLESSTTHVRNTVIQRYDLSLPDLQYINWTLVYPPSPNMNAIKMYPPYGTYNKIESQSGNNDAVNQLALNGEHTMGIAWYDLDTNIVINTLINTLHLNK